MSDSFDDWMQFRRGENPSPSPKTLPCICCEKPTSEADSAPGSFGDWSGEGIPLATLCIPCNNDWEVMNAPE